MDMIKDMNWLERIALTVILVLVLAVSITGCSKAPDPQPVVQQQVPAQVVQQPMQPMVIQQPAPVVVQQQPTHDGFFTGMLMGHLLSGGSGGGAASHTTTVTKNVTVINKAPAPNYNAQAMVRSPMTPRPSYSFRSSSSSSFRRR